MSCTGIQGSRPELSYVQFEIPTQPASVHDATERKQDHRSFWYQTDPTNKPAAVKAVVWKKP